MAEKLKKIIVASGNEGKLIELRAILDDLPYTLVSMREFWKAHIEIDENGSTFNENARIKADWVHKHSLLWALADDSGLMVDALGGAPGVHSARFAGSHGDTAANNRKLVSLIKDIPVNKRKARFVCSVVLRISESLIVEAEGVCKGHLLDEPHGTGGFGYDPLFVPDGFNRTFAEMTDGEKNAISHRGRAMMLLKEKLNEYPT